MKKKRIPSLRVVRDSARPMSDVHIQRDLKLLHEEIEAIISMIDHQMTPEINKSNLKYWENEKE